MTLFKFTAIVEMQLKNLVVMTGLLLVMQARPKVSEEKDSGFFGSFLFGRHVITMKIIKVINNNVVSALDKDAEEVVIMGKGIGFHAKPGQIVNEEQIEKTFRLEDKKSAGQFARLVERLPVEYLKLSDQIITYAKNNIGLKLHQSIYLTLTDHISFAIERYKKGMQFDNPLKVEVKTFIRSSLALESMQSARSGRSLMWS